MSQTIQEDKYITVQEFIPAWTDLIEKTGGIQPFKRCGMDEGENHLNITDSKVCLVGEAHGFKPYTDNYSDETGNGFCKHCKFVALGRKSANGIFFSDAIDDLKNLYQFKEGLYDHFMEAHPEKLLRK